MQSLSASAANSGGIVAAAQGDSRPFVQNASPPSESIDLIFGFSHSPELAEELRRIELDVAQEREHGRLLELARQLDLERLRELARFD